MTPSQAFSLANGFALLGWLLLAAAVFVPPQGPWRPRLLALAGRVWPLLLALAYAAALGVHWGRAPDGGFGTLDAVAALFREPGLLLAGWLHYLAFDLFVGAWMVADAASRGFRVGVRLALLPCLVLTFAFGPVGLLSYLALRTPLFTPETRHAP